MNGRSHQRLPISERGSALLVAMCFTLVLALALASYQALCYTTLKTSSRNTQSLHGRQLAEAGIEEALWAINNSAISSPTWSIYRGTATRSNLSFSYEGSTRGTVTLTIKNYDGTFSADGLSTAYDQPRTITAKAVITTTDGPSSTRTLTASINPLVPASGGDKPYMPTIANAIAANTTSGTVNLTSGGLTVDSYDSSKGTYNVTLSDGTKNAGYSAVVAGNSVTVANGAQVKGYVATSSSSTATYGSTAKLTGPTTSATVKVDTTRQSTNPNQIAVDISAPTGAGTTLSEPSSGTVHLGTAGATTPTIYYATNYDSLYGYGSGWYVLGAGTLSIDGPVIIVVSNNFYISGSGSISISSTAGANASLQLYVGGSAYIYYNGINNLTKLAKNLAIFGTGTYVANVVQLWTPTKFYGTIYAPKADIAMYGYSSVSEFFGSVVGNNVTVYPYSSTALPIHYDKDLRNTQILGTSTAITPIVAATVTETN